MTNRRMKFLAFAAVALVSLFLPATASAQRPWWERDNDSNNRGYGRLSDHERRTLRDAARRIDDRSKSFQRNIDRRLDNSRIDDTRREDRVNQEVSDFRRAAARFRDRAGSSNDRDRGKSEAQQLLNEAERVSRLVSRVRLDARTQSDWSQIRADLRTVADIYNIRTGNFGGNGRGRDDDYGRDTSRDRRSPRNFPFPD